MLSSLYQKFGLCTFNLNFVYEIYSINRFQSNVYNLPADIKEAGFRVIK